jgi:hypothetical protein
LVDVGGSKLVTLVRFLVLSVLHLLSIAGAILVARGLAVIS